MTDRKLAIIEVKPGAAMESQSGLQMNAPRIFGAYEEPTDGARRVAAIVMHPTSNFMGHYLITPLAARGIACLGLNSRYAGSDVMLLMERVIQDLGAGVRFLRDRGYERIVLIGNSGGAALVSFYQAEAERLTVTATPAGDPINLTPEDLPPADAIVLSAAHAGRARLMAEWIDPSVISEDDPDATDPALDCYDPANGPPFSEEFLARFRAAQRARQNRIEGWARARLAELRRNPHGPQNQAFLVHRTHADPRMIDLTLDANDRPRGSIWGDPSAVNRSANAMGRFTTLTAFLSQWAGCSQADGPDNLARTSVPVCLFDHTGDASTFPSTIRLWQQAYGDRGETHALTGGNHYLLGQAALVTRTADIFRDFIDRKLS
jgi:dienelactone hydrolase